MLTPRRELEFDATVPRKLVHRAAVHEVFLTDFLSLEDEALQVGAHLPRFHGLYADRLTAPGSPDLMLLMETCRQAAVLVAHRHLGVPIGHHFVLLESDIRVPANDVGPINGSNARLTVDVINQKERNGFVSQYEIEIVTTIDEIVVCVARLNISCWEPGPYTKLRGGRSVSSVTPLPPCPAAEPWLVGRRHPDNVTVNPLEPDSGSYSVRVDTSHPSFFDHPLEHVPGMLVLEAARQATVHLSASRFMRSPWHANLVGCRAAFSRFAELDAPLVATATIVKDGLEEMIADVTITQDGELCARVENQIAFVADSVPRRSPVKAATPAPTATAAEAVTSA